MIDANWTYSFCYLDPWNPLSSETTLSFETLRRFDLDDSIPIPKPTFGNQTIGFISNIIQSRIRDAKDMRSGQYKYVIVLLGLNEGQATADRLAGLLAHSGAVILLQESKFVYHFSSFLKPWVHYVPISYSLGGELRADSILALFYDFE